MGKAEPEEAKKGTAKQRKQPFAHFLEPGFPFAEIVVDARNLGDGFPKDNLTPRGLVVRLAEDTYIAYDTDLCRVACAWTGGFLTEESLATMSYQNAKKKKGGGQGVLPEPIGTAIFANGLYPGVQLGSEPNFKDPRPVEVGTQEVGRGALPEGMAQWSRSTVQGDAGSVNYAIGGIEIWERPWLDSARIIGRDLSVSAHPEGTIQLVLGGGHVKLLDQPPGSKLHRRDGIHYLTLPESGDDAYFSILQSDGPIEAAAGRRRPDGFAVGFRTWPDTVATEGQVSSTSDAYAVEAIDLPIANPQRRNIRPTGIDFFPDGRAVVVTFDGDLWVVSGLDTDLAEVGWERIAGGLHEPNSVRISKTGEIFVFGRNSLTKIVDAGQVDPGGATPPGWCISYQNFCSDFWQSAETRDFAHSMAIASDGSFFITKGGQQNDMPSKHSGRALKISPDGKKVEIFASGLRNAYLTIRPGSDEIYASDQQGHWVPATPVHRIVEGGYYGFQPAAPWGVPEPPITPPLCWIPHAVAGSGLEPVWADKERFGPLSDSLVYLDFQRPGLLRTYLNDRKGQAATVPMPLEFGFPLLKGAVNPVDGQLYLVGFQIWGTSAKEIRGMARVRYTGKASVLPTRVVAGKNAIALHFEQALDPAVAEFTVRRWNYRRSADYGSGHYRPDGKAGEEILTPGGVELSADRRAVLISTPELHPVQQLAVSYNLKTASGKSFTNAAYLTLHEISALDLAAEGFPETDLKQLAAQTKANTTTKAEPVAPTEERGAVVYQSIGCAACHSVDGSTNGKSGPTWKDLAGSERQLQDGGSARATTEYLRESILDPTAKVTRGYNPKDVGMPSYQGILSESDLESVILFIESLK